MSEARPTIHISASPGLLEVIFRESDLDRLGQLGDVTRDGQAPASAVQLLDYDIVVSSWDTPSLPVELPPRSRLRLIAHAGGTVRRIVPRALLDAGVLVTQASAAMAEAVAEHSLTMCLALLRHLHIHDRAFQAGDAWSGQQAGLGRAFAAQRVGVIGASRTGRAFIRMARSLGAVVVVYDPYLSEADARRLGAERNDLDGLLAICDVVALHAPVTAETTRMVGAEQLARMRDGAIVVNTARAPLVDTDALVSELVSGRLCAGLDVFDDEPVIDPHPLTHLPNVLLTPHQAGATAEARREQGRQTIDEVERYCSGGPLAHEVTFDTYDQLA